MTLQFSLAVANARLGAIESTIGTSAVLIIYSGTKPADCATASAGGTDLLTFNLPSDWMATAQNNVVGPTSMWVSQANTSQSGTATYFRIYDSTVTTCHLQGTVSTVAAGTGDLQLSSTTIVPYVYVQMSAVFFREPGVRPFQGTMSLSLGSLTDSADGTVANTSWDSIDFGDWGVASAPSAPPNGMLFSVWGKRNDQISTFPFTGGNHEFLNFYFGNWYLRVVGWNCIANSSGDTDCWWNSNSMIIADGTSVGEAASSYAGDYTWLGENGHTVSQLNGWVFHAFQAWNDSANSQIILRMWVKFAGSSVQGPYTTTLTYTQMRTDLVNNGGWTQVHADAWTPSSTVTGLSVGSNYDTVKNYFIHGRVESNTGTPSNSYIESIAALTAADTGAWADWELNWTGGAANLTDRSGNGRTLTTGSTFTQGLTFP